MFSLFGLYYTILWESFAFLFVFSCIAIFITDLVFLIIVPYRPTILFCVLLGYCYFFNTFVMKPFWFPIYVNVSHFICCIKLYQNTQHIQC
jgi:hypothetical protein